MELIKIKQCIEDKIAQLSTGKAILEQTGKNMVEAEANYIKKKAKTILGLRNGKEFHVEGERVVNPPVTIIESIARGYCWKELMARDMAAIAYKNLVEGINILKSQKNGYEKILDKFDE